MVKVSLWFKFSSTNNQYEYGVVITELTLVAEIGAKNVKFRTYPNLCFSSQRGKRKQKIYKCNDI